MARQNGNVTQERDRVATLKQPQPIAIHGEMGYAAGLTYDVGQFA